MANFEYSVDVDVPVRTAYNQWTQFEEFPKFMSNVKEVRQLSDTRLHWQAEIMGKEEEWDAEIDEQTPDQRVAWHSISGARNAGVVTFHYLDENTTRVMLQLDYEPQGMVENIGSALGVVKANMKADLENFKEFIEARGTESGGWRGTVERQTTP